MIELSVLDARVERCCAELERVAERRPFLRSRCERAENILVAHLSFPRGGFIKARVRGGELAGYLVRGSSGEVYRVEASGRWKCSCPDSIARRQACKHALAAWALWRAAGVAPRPAAAEPAEELEPEEIPAEIVPIREPRGRSLRRDRVRGDGELPVADPAAIDRMAERMGVA